MESARRNEVPLSEASGPDEDETDASRREMLAKIGRFAYVAPALAILAEPKLAEAYGVARDVPRGPPSNLPPGQNK